MNETEHERHHDALAVYALGALEPGEAAELERHLAGCQGCRTELEWLRPAVQLLPESVERHESPPELRARLMGQVRAEAGTPAPPRAAARWRSRSWGLRPIAALSALALVVVAAAAYAIGNGSGGAGTTTVVAGQSPGVTAEVVRDGEAGTLRLMHLPSLPPGKVLQTWVERNGRVESARELFYPDAKGIASAPVDDMDGVSRVMVTAEPSGGSIQPTGEPLITVRIPQ